MSLNNKENITYNDDGFNVTSEKFNSCIHLDWSEVKWKPKNIEKYVLYVLESVANQKNVFDGAKPLIERVVTEPRAMVKINNVNLRKRLDDHCIVFFVGAIEKGKSEPSWKPSSWKQAKIWYSITPNIWVDYLDGIKLSEETIIPFDDFFMKYKKVVLKNNQSLSIKDLLRAKSVQWAFYEEPFAKGMTVDEANKELKKYTAYSKGNDSIVVLPSEMEELLKVLESVASNKDKVEAREKGLQSFVDKLSLEKIKNLADKLSRTRYAQRYGRHKTLNDLLKKILKSKLPAQSSFPAKATKNTAINVIVAILVGTAWTSMKCYRVSSCELPKISWDPVPGNGKYELTEVYERDRKVYSGTETTCIDREKCYGCYLLVKNDWEAYFVLKPKVVPFFGMNAALVELN